MITPTNRLSSNPVYFGALLWVDLVAQHHTWSTTIRVAEVELGEHSGIISLPPYEVVVNEYTGLIANLKYGRPLAHLSSRSSNRRAHLVY